MEKPSSFFLFSVFQFNLKNETLVSNFNFGFRFSILKMTNCDRKINFNFWFQFCVWWYDSFWKLIIYTHTNTETKTITDSFFNVITIQKYWSIYRSIKKMKTISVINYPISIVNHQFPNCAKPIYIYITRNTNTDRNKNINTYT